MEVRVARLDTCPKPSKVVGFTILHKPTGKSLYLDAFVPLEECGDPELQRTDRDIAAKAWEMVKPGATQWIAEIEKKDKSIVGTLIDI